jgi:hypothetical protein
MPRVSGKPSRRWPWWVVAVVAIAVIAFVALWATGVIY